MESSVKSTGDKKGKKMTTKKVYITTRVSEKLKEKIETISQKEEITSSEFIRQAIKEKIKSTEE